MPGLEPAKSAAGWRRQRRYAIGYHVPEIGVEDHGRTVDEERIEAVLTEE
jgi:hypothetical protein